MAFMSLSLVELLCQAVMGRVPTLEYLLSRAHGAPRPCPVVPGA
jgi:hypothetical protein